MLYSRFNVKISDGVEGKIVGGYDVDKKCMPRPWMILIKCEEKERTLLTWIIDRIKPIDKRDGEGNCGGVIINKVNCTLHCTCTEPAVLARSSDYELSFVVALIPPNLPISQPRSESV